MSERQISDWDAFLREDNLSRDVIAVRRIYVRISGDLAAGVMLSQIIYWFLDDRHGNKKTTINFDGEDWIAKKLSDWDDECVLSPDQARRCLKLLIDKGLIVCVNRKFNGTPTTHIRVVKDAMIRAYKGGGTPNGLGVEPKSEMGNNPSGSGEEPKSYNKEEITTETTAEILSPSAYEPEPVLQLCIQEPRPLRESVEKLKPPLSRHALFRAELGIYWERHNRHEMPWVGSEGSQLSSVLSASPKLTAEEFRQWLTNRSNSESVNHAERPSLWLSRVSSYASGPLDTFKNPKSLAGKKYDDSAKHLASTREALRRSLGVQEIGKETSGGQLPVRIVAALESSTRR